MGHQPIRRDAYRGRTIPMCYYDIDDTGFYDEFGNPIDPSQMNDYRRPGTVAELLSAAAAGLRAAAAAGGILNALGRG